MSSSRRYLPLAHRLASRYRNSGEPMDDLQQVAASALINSVDRYDPDAGPFVRYAVPNILGELKRHFRDKGVGHPRAALAPGAHAQGQPRRSTSCRRELGRTAHAQGRRRGDRAQPRGGAGGDGRVERVLAAAAGRPAGADDDEGAAPWPTRSAARTSGSSWSSWATAWRLRSALCPSASRLILKLRFVDDLTQAEIAERIGVSQMHVSRLLRRSLSRLSEWREE